MKYLFLLSLFFHFQVQDEVEIEIIGVYQGKTLFIQNPYRPTEKRFCIRSVFVNNRRLDLNYDLSAIKIDFENNDMFTPVTIRVVSSDSICSPIIINPDAILFHTSYKFTHVSLSDTALVWETEGEREAGTYFVEKLQNGIWLEMDRISAKGLFELAEYRYIPRLEEGGNKYRVKYEFGNDKYLYSSEVDFDYYPEPVTFSPKTTSRKLTFSRPAFYEIYDGNSKLVLSGQGLEVDVTRLWPGDYVIYFDGRDPGVFTKER